MSKPIFITIDNNRFRFQIRDVGGENLSILEFSFRNILFLSFVEMQINYVQLPFREDPRWWLFKLATERHPVDVNRCKVCINDYAIVLDCEQDLSAVIPCIPFSYYEFTKEQIVQAIKEECGPIEEQGERKGEVK